MLNYYKNNKIMFMHHCLNKLVFDENVKQVFKILKIDDDIKKIIEIDYCLMIFSSSYVFN
jgi:hypothetical protein